MIQHKPHGVIKWLSLTKFASIARQYGVDFEVNFTDTRSYVWIGGTLEEWQNGPFIQAVKTDGGVLQNYNSGMRLRLESLS